MKQQRMNTAASSLPGVLAPQGRWERNSLPSVPAILVAEAAAGAAGLGATGFGAAPWAAGTAALVLGGSTLVRRRGTSAAEWAVRAGRRGPQAVRDAGFASFPGGGDIGVRPENGLHTAVLRPVPSAPRIVDLTGSDDPGIPLDVLAGALHRTDTPAARIDILLSGGRAPSDPEGPRGPRGRYLDMLGPLARWATSEAVIAVSIDPYRCRDAATRRRGDHARVAALAARRVMDALAAAGITTTALGREELDGVAVAAPAGASYIDARSCAGGDFGDLWVQSGRRTTAAITLRPADAHGSDTAISAWIASTDVEDPPRRRRTPSAAVGDAAALRRMRVPLAGCGQILGADPAGRPIAVRLHGHGVRSVWAAVADDPAVQLVERAVATGARVLVVTGRPDVWRPLVHWTNSPETLWISGWRYPPHLAGLRPSGYTVTVLDGIAGAAAPHLDAEQTVWRLESRGNSPTAEADVVLSQPQPGMLTVRTDGGAATVRLVA